MDRQCIISLSLQKLQSIPMLTHSLIFIAILTLTSHCADITDLLLRGESGKSHTFDVTSIPNGNIIQVKFRIIDTSSKSTISLYASTDDDLDHEDIELSDFYHKSDHPNFDIDGMWDSRDQYINLEKVAGENTLYLTVFKFDPAHRIADINYDITITNGPGYLCQSCANAETYNSECYCRNCRFGTTGKICSRKIYSVDKNTTLQITRNEPVYLALPEMEAFKLELRFDRGFGEGYVQFEDFNGEVATFYNVARSESGDSDGRYLLTESGVSIDANAGGKRTLVTAITFVNSVEFTLIYYETKGVSILIIVMAVLGGLILIGLIIAAVCIIRRNRANTARVQSENALPSNSSKLSAAEIERYFPPVVLGSLLSASAGQPETSINEMNNEKDRVEQDCVICLQPIQEEEKIRLGFCRHMFHSDCLVGWFNKQRNCPYCRKEYNKPDTQKAFEQLVEKNGNKNLKELELVRAVYLSKPSSQTVIQNIE